MDFASSCSCCFPCFSFFIFLLSVSGLRQMAINGSLNEQWIRGKRGDGVRQSEMQTCQS